MSKKNILAIETSCDETAIAIIKTSPKGRSFRVLSNVVLSQIPIHAEWGGVVPNLAKREHQRNLTPLLLQALNESKLLKIFNPPAGRAGFQFPNKFQILNSILEREPELLQQFLEKIISLPKPDINLIAVTQGPGLEPALWIGVNFARSLSALWDIPLVGINHMEGHIASALLKQSGGISNFQFPISKKISNSKSHKRYTLAPIPYPALALLVSGGHTELVLIKKPLKYKIIGETRDDAAGEAFDKVARILGLGYPGGPAIAVEANLEARLPLGSRASRASKSPRLPRPMMHTKDYDFSFSGLKTAVLYLVRDLEKQGKNIKKLRPLIAKEFQDAVVDVLVSKTVRAAKEYKVKSILLGGGVAANTELRKRLGEKIKIEIPNTKYYIPDTHLTGDNALMIAITALQHASHAQKTSWNTIKPQSGMRLS